jgi:hypothetical protein
MKEAIEVLNELENEGFFSRYAIGGAMAATFYVEPILTYDLDIFVIFPESAGLAPLSPLYERLRGMGFAEDGECVRVHGVPVQFLPAYNVLLKCALKEAIETEYDGTPTRVLSIEYLIAICLQTGRPKDRDRVRLFREEAAIDNSKLNAILGQHGLEGTWKNWTK